MSKLKIFFRFFLGMITGLLSILIPKKKNLVVLTGSNFHRYNESTRYLFEYLLQKKELDSVWVTSSDVVKQYLVNQGYRVVKLKSLRGLWTA